MARPSSATRKWCIDMSGFDVTTEFTGSSEATDTVTAVREALGQVQKEMAVAGRGPQLLAGMTWRSPEPSRFHPARREVDLAYREVFGGFRPHIALERASQPGLVVRATLRRTLAASLGRDAAMFGPYDRQALAREYSPRLQADMGEVFRRWSRDGAAFRARHPALDIAYGSTRDETFDLFLPKSGANPPVWVFIHGGYWQASDKEQHAQFAAGMLKSGFAVAMPNYGLAPETAMPMMVTQMMALIAFLRTEGRNLGIDGTRLHVAGHSAGAHLAAMVAAWALPSTLRSALLLSGIFDLKPLTLLPVIKLLRASNNPAKLSPIAQPMPQGVRVRLAVGEAESDEFKRQSGEMATAWKAPAPLIVPGHHFSMLDGLNGGPLLDLAREAAAD